MGNSPERTTQEDQQPIQPLLDEIEEVGGTTASYQNDDSSMLLDIEEARAPVMRRHSRSSSRDVEALLPFLSPNASGFSIWPFGSMMEEPKELCKICLMEHPVSDMYLLHCEHRFCKECLTHWYTSKIRGGEVDLICVYLDEHTGKCMEPLLEEEIKDIVSADTFAKYERFRRMQDKLVRECPFCTETQRGDPASPEMICNNCGQVYCFLHSNAHPGEDCKDYTERMREEFLKNREAAGKDAKECPGCGILVQKSQGCNHMTCTRCKTEFCYICGADITGDENVIRHYRDGQCDQFDFDFQNNPFFRVVRSIISIYMGILFLPLLLVAFVLCIPLFPLALYRAEEKTPEGICRHWRYNYFFMCNQWLFIIFVASPLLLIALVAVLPFSLFLISARDGCEPVRQAIRTIYSSLMMILIVALFFPLLVVLFAMCCCVCVARPALLNPNYGQPENGIPRADEDIL